MEANQKKYMWGIGAMVAAVGAYLYFSKSKNKAVNGTDDSDGVDFWKKQFIPRTKKWQRDTLKRLRADKLVFGDAAERRDKINALNSLLKK